MASRLSRTLLAQVARPAVRASRNAGRRMMSTEAHGASKGGDMPWIIGSAVVFGPLAFYLLTPPSKDKAHKAAEHALPKKKEPTPEAAPVPVPESLPTTDDEGTKVPAGEVAESAQAAVNTDSPADAQAAEEGKGTTPQEAAQKAEEPAESEAPKEEAPKEETPAPENEQSEKPGEHHAGTLQSGEDSGPSDTGDARKESTQGKDPKKAAQ